MKAVRPETTFSFFGPGMTKPKGPLTGDALVEWANSFIERGWSVFLVHGPQMTEDRNGNKIPEKDRGKTPFALWSKNGYGTKSADKIRAATKEVITPLNLGLALGTHSNNLVALDLDKYEQTQRAVVILTSVLRLTVGLDTSVVQTGEGSHTLYQTNQPMEPMQRDTKGMADKLIKFKLFTSEELSAFTAKANLVDVRSTGQYIVAPGSLHRSGRHYESITELPPKSVKTADLLSAIEFFMRYWPYILLLQKAVVSGNWHMGGLTMGVWLRDKRVPLTEAKLLANVISVLDSQTTGSICDSVLADKVVEAYDGDYDSTVATKEGTGGLANIEGDLETLWSLFPLVTSVRSPLAARKVFAPEAEKEVAIEDEAIEAAIPTEEAETIDAEFDASVEAMSWEDIVEIFRKHLKLTNDYEYTEILLAATQSRLRVILAGSCVYLYFSGIFSSGKSYATELATYLSGGEMLTTATEAGIGRMYLDQPGMTVGLDEFDQLSKKYTNLESFVRTTYNWNATMVVNLPNGEAGWTATRVRVGGPKFFNGYDNIDQALASRCAQIEMERHISREQIIEKFLGYPVMHYVRRWLDLRCKRTQLKWNQDLLVEYLRSDEFAAIVDPLVKQTKIPRKLEIAIAFLVLGKLLDIEVGALIKAYMSSAPELTNKMEVYRGVLVNIHNRISPLLKEPLAPNEIRNIIIKGSGMITEFRTNENGHVEMKMLDLLGLMNAELFDRAREAIGTGYWPRVLESLGFTKGQNWKKEARRNEWRLQSYLIFDNDVLSGLGQLVA
jgi:hypothetical protein